jgi:signal peptidase II
MAIRCLIALLLVGGLVGCDHVTKEIAQDGLRGEPPVGVVSSVLDLSYTENRDVGFGGLRFIPEATRRPLIIGVNLVIVTFIVGWWIRRRRARLLEHLALALIVAGALGNALERLFRGYVIDFIHIHHWPVFNAADVYLVVGAALLLLATWTRRARPRAAPT